ncbi:hypothetical protein ACIPUC_16200 [Streptomyces sp. LARHCF249]
MPADPLSPLIAATTQWLLCAYPPGPGALRRALAEAQAQQAVTIAAWLRYPTELDAQLVAFTGPGGSNRLDWITGGDVRAAEGPDEPDAWRSWVDEVVASWAACLLGAPPLASAAAAALAGTVHCGAVPMAFARLTEPAEGDRRAAALLRHPDLLAPIAELHRAELLGRLSAESAPAE